jgi:hypothetical protein
MASCEYRPSCNFFKKQAAVTPDTPDNPIDKYCHGEYSKCARFMVSRSRGIDSVSDTLTPESFNRPKCFCAM